MGTTRTASFDNTQRLDSDRQQRKQEVQSLATSTNSFYQERELEQSKSMAIVTSV